MKSENVKKEIEMCTSILVKLKKEMIDCKKDYDFLMSKKEKYGNSDEHKQAVKIFKEKYDGLKTTVDLLNERLNFLKQQ